MENDRELALALEKTRRWLDEADGVLITAGAGMGVDSGLPDFRGREGFWRAYPALGRARMDFQEAACPDHFRQHPHQAWGFYGHRLALYRQAVPHEGFQRLARYGATRPAGAFVFTSNVDGQFQKAGFFPAQICEIHGSIHHLQCLAPCSEAIWSAGGFDPVVDAAACQLTSELPHCPACGGLARPNILMFGDWGWIQARTAAQQAALDTWRQSVRRLVVLELGAGNAVPTVRWFGEGLGAPLIRINPRAFEVVGHRAVGLPLGAEAALAALLP